jgi:Uma2 family endonuclease
MMTVDEFLSLPDDGVHRELIEGEVRVVRQELWDDPNAPVIPVSSEKIAMTVRNRFHSRTLVRISYHLESWLESQLEPRGEFVGGECGFRMDGAEGSAIWIDIAFVSAEVVAATPSKQKIFDAPPVLAVEILSPSDTHEDIVAKVELYLGFGVVVWIVDLDLRTVAVYRPGEFPESFNESQDLIGDPYLPGFRVAVSRLFGR